ncbi:MAG: presenilin family intramembrane aspartyl protease [bacterium]|nr:presenilin family intramembrane aspartyl protease [bacterium]
MRFIKLSVALQTLVALLLTEALSVASLFFLKKEPLLAVSAPHLTAVEFIVAFLFATAFLFLLLKFFHGRAIFEFIFSLAIFGGIWFLASIFIADEKAILLASALTLSRFILPYVLVQNLIMIFGIAGVAATVGTSLSWRTAMIILVVLSIYDFVAVYETKHMVKMFKGLLERGVMFAMVLPDKPSGQISHLRHIKPGEDFSFLGTGDLAMPAIFTVAAFAQSPGLGVGAAIGSFFGLGLTDFIFDWGRRRPMPALPPIVLGTIVGFFVAMIVLKMTQ